MSSGEGGEGGEGFKFVRGSWCDGVTEVGEDVGRKCECGMVGECGYSIVNTYNIQHIKINNEC